MRRLFLFLLILGVLALGVAAPAVASPPPAPGPGSHNACNGLHVAGAQVSNATAFGHIVTNDLALCHGE